MSYPICFVSLGPGDPELITLKGLKKLRQAEIIYCPATMNKNGQLLSRAARIIEELGIGESAIRLFTLPMSKDRTEAWKVGTGKEFYTSDRKQIQGKIFPYFSLMIIQ